jgi:DNA polymerase-3 subunit gamma/tau
VDAIIKEDAAAGLNTLQASLDAGSDPRQFARQVVDYMRNVMLVRMGNAENVDTTAEVRQVMAQHAQAFDETKLLHVIQTFNKVAVDSRTSWQPSLPLELAFMESLSSAVPQPATAGNPAPSQKTGGAPTPGRASKTSPNPEKKEKTDKPAPYGGQMDKDDWQKILAQVKAKSPTTTALLNSCRSIEWGQGVLCLGFASDLLCQKMAQEDHAALLITVASEVLGDSIELKCIINSGNIGDLPSDVDASGMVATGMRLGGEIVDVQDLAKGKEEKKK